MEASETKFRENSTKGEVSEKEIIQSVNDGTLTRKRQPFNFGIKELKRVLDRMDMPSGTESHGNQTRGLTRAEKNKTIKMYKERLYERVEEVKEKMEKVGLQNAADK